MPSKPPYHDLATLRLRPSFEVLAARRASDGRRVVLVRPGPAADPAAAEAALDEIVRVHALLAHPAIPAARRAASALVELDCPAVLDGIECLRRLGAANRRLSYGAADAFIVGLREAMESAHAIVDPSTGASICLGRISLGNVLFDERGRHHLIGFGHNLPIEDERGAVDGAITFFQAPELAAGCAPTPCGDYVALVLFMRSLLPYVDIQQTAVGRILRGDVRPSDQPLLEALRWVEQELLGRTAAERPPIREAVEVAARIRALMAVTLDPDGFAALVAEVAPGVATAGAVPPTLTLDEEGAWVGGPDGQRRRTGRAMRRILLALVAQHRAHPGEALTVWELLEAGWPGERLLARAGANRVYVEVNRLRRLGLQSIVERFDQGYRLAPRTRVEIAR